MKMYAPYHYDACRIRSGDIEYSPARNMVEWNLIWLSLPIVDKIPPPTDKFTEFLEAFPFKASGALRGIAFETWVAEAMGPSAVAFVEAMQGYDWSERPTTWMNLGGQGWLDTMVKRAYQADGLAGVYAAAQSANVIIGNFTKRAGASTGPLR